MLYSFRRGAGAAVWAAILSLGFAAGVARSAVRWDGDVLADPTRFELSGNWDTPTYNPVPSVGPEDMPPGDNSIFNIGGANHLVILSDDRSGAGETEKLGTFAIGAGSAADPDAVSTFIIRNNVTFTGQERMSSGEVNPALRPIRIGRADTSGKTSGDGRTDFPWGIVIHEAGLFTYDPAVTADAAQLRIAMNDDIAGGGIFEVGGTASLIIPDDVRIGDRATATSMPGAIFRVRGSSVGEVTIGDAFQVASDAGLWDAHRDGQGRLQFNRGKSVVEFVLDAGGVTPITILDNLEIGDVNPYPAGHTQTGNEYTYGFLRIKLSQPTTAGSGVVGSGDELVLFKADRINTDTAMPTGTDYDEGRFFDPDRLSASGGPHRPLFDSQNPLEPDTIYRVIADYAGQQYSWRIDYFDSPIDGVVIDAVVLSELQITGVAGDLNGDNLLNEADRAALQAAIASPPASRYDLLAAKQHLFDLNADGVIDGLDLATFNTHFLGPTGTPGDFNSDGKVDAADYTVWRNNLNSNTALPNDDGLGTPIRPAHYSLWKTNFGMGTGGAGSVSAVPEPSSILMALLCVAGVVGLRRRVA